MDLKELTDRSEVVEGTVVELWRRRAAPGAAVHIPEYVTVLHVKEKDGALLTIPVWGEQEALASTLLPDCVILARIVRGNEESSLVGRLMLVDGRTSFLPHPIDTVVVGNV